MDEITPRNLPQHAQFTIGLCHLLWNTGMGCVLPLNCWHCLSPQEWHMGAICEITPGQIHWVQKVQEYLCSRREVGKRKMIELLLRVVLGMEGPRIAPGHPRNTRDGKIERALLQ